MKIPDTPSRISIKKCINQNTEYANQNTKYANQNTKYTNQNTTYDNQNIKSAIPIKNTPAKTSSTQTKTPGMPGQLKDYAKQNTNEFY